MLNTHDVIANSGITFGTSGARGLVTDFTQDVCAAFTVSFIETMRLSFEFTTIAIAIDNRPSSEAMAKACATAAEQMGTQVVYYGVIPTPALAFQAMELNIPSIMVTGSHIPFDRNGLKFYRPDGEITKQDEQSIINGQFSFSSLTHLAALPTDSSAEEAYIARYVSLFDTSWLKGKRIGIYQHSSAGRDIYPTIFEQLGADVILIGRSDTFVPIDTEAVSDEDCQRAIDWTHKYQLDALFSTDGDGDRPMLADEKGHWLCGDILGLLAAKALNISALSVPVSCNSAIELSNYFDFVFRTKIGSPYVIEGFSTLNDVYSSFAGFEANGGFLLGSDIEVNGKKLAALPTRDAVLPVLMVLFNARNSSVVDLLQALPSRHTHSNRLTEFANDKSRKIISFGNSQPKKLLQKLKLEADSLVNINTVDGLRCTLANNTIIHLRPSGNAPEFRCYIESDSKQKAIELNEFVLTQLSSLDMMELNNA
ncbi:phosphomannomutase [Shewanella gaetbuli]|uniref:Phosphomannomutase n=1 Tax=Shewanella gaetbuli TaxID=220752 RepID=A0A9X1ZSF2_9GAMM|nr:phosphomannomutase [Shewanella gaetbuli]MCL1143248.1 phosphomannomutase [Shewanella gaetbuli]